MDASIFEELLSMVSSKIRRQDTVMRQAISPGERLAITLRFLATGETFESLKFLYRVPAQTFGRIITETCLAIGDVLLDKYLKVPTTQAEWATIAQAFKEKWNFHNCVGAINGKRILIPPPPPNSGSYYFSYKHRFGIVLLSIVDADYNFLFVDIGCNDRISDGGVFRNSILFHALENDSLNIPKRNSF